MRAVLDTCVLYPPVLREILIGAARAGLFQPAWSASILDEWRHVAARDGEVNRQQIDGEIALLNAHFPKATVALPDPIPPELLLPDAADTHVLATALAGDAPQIVTANLRDFPPRELAVHGVTAVHPDAFLLDLLHARPDEMRLVVEDIRAQAQAMAGQEITLKQFLKRARLPRLAKALTRSG